MTTKACEMQNLEENEKAEVFSQPDLLDSLDSILKLRQLRISVKENAVRGDYLSAIALLDRLLVCHPDSAIDYNNRGLMYFYLKQFLPAIEDYNRAIDLNKKLDNAYNNRANCHAAQGNFLAALSDYEMALDLNPTNLRALINQSITFRELGLYELALENFEIALIWGQKLAGRIYAERGYTYYLRGDWNCAIGDYQRALECLPDSDYYRQKVREWLSHLLEPTDS
jgi:tetratricopeptide (TPR) repeat protein